MKSFLQLAEAAALLAIGFLSVAAAWTAHQVKNQFAVIAAQTAVVAGNAATADLMLSQRCISAHTCHEANPLLPANATITGASVLEAGETGLSMWAFHRFRQSHSKLAWIIPGVNIGVHALGIWSYERGR